MYTVSSSNIGAAKNPMSKVSGVPDSRDMHKLFDAQSVFFMPAVSANFMFQKTIIQCKLNIPSPVRSCSKFVRRCIEHNKIYCGDERYQNPWRAFKVKVGIT